MPKQQTAASRPSLFDKIHLWMSTGRNLDGIWVGSWRTPSDLSRVEDALLLIKRHSPLHYSRVVRDLSRVWILLMPGSLARYDHSLNACVLDERYVANPATTLEQIASTIVHEATHARLEHWGVTYDEQMRPRIEAICFRRELAFAVKLPDSTQLQEEILRSLEWYEANPEYFSNTKFRERDDHGVIEAFRYLQAPDWFIRVTPTLRSAISRVRQLFRNITRRQTPTDERL